MPDLVVGRQLTRPVEDVFEILDLVCRRLGHVGLERVQDALVVHDPQGPRGPVAVIAADIDNADGLVCRQTRVHCPQRFGCGAHVAMAKLIAVGTFIV